MAGCPPLSLSSVALWGLGSLNSGLGYAGPCSKLDKMFFLGCSIRDTYLLACDP